MCTKKITELQSRIIEKSEKLQDDRGLKAREEILENRQLKKINAAEVLRAQAKVYKNTKF